MATRARRDHKYNYVSIPSQKLGQAGASCPAGELLTGGGFAYNSGLTVQASLPKPVNAAPTEWYVAATNTSAVPQALTVYAVCASTH